MSRAVAEEIAIIKGVRIAQIYTPKTSFKGGQVKWLDESKYLKKNHAKA